MPREIAHVVGDDEAGHVVASVCLAEIALAVAEEADGRADDIEIVEDGGAHGGIGGLAAGACAALGLRHDLAHGAICACHRCRIRFACRNGR